MQIFTIVFYLRKNKKLGKRKIYGFLKSKKNTVAYPTSEILIKRANFIPNHRKVVTLKDRQIFRLNRK